MFVARMGVCWSYLVEGAGLVGAVYLNAFGSSFIKESKMSGSVTWQPYLDTP